VIYEQRNNNKAEVYNGITCVRCDYVNLHFSDIYVIIYALCACIAYLRKPIQCVYMYVLLCGLVTAHSVL